MRGLFASILFVALSQPACIAHEQAATGKEAPAADQTSVPPGAVATTPLPAVVPPGARIKSGKLAVLDFKSSAKDLSGDDVRHFGDLVRGATLKAAPQLEVMTRENQLVLLQSSGKDLSNCEGACAVDTGRRIGADAIVSGEVLKVGARYKLTLRREWIGGCARSCRKSVAIGPVPVKRDEPCN